MLSLFRKKKKTVLIVNELGEFRYFVDSVDEYWQRTSKYIDRENSIDIDFLALPGSTTCIDEQGEKLAIELLNNPQELWSFVDRSFIDIASEDSEGLSVRNVRDKFYIKSLAIDSRESFEIGYHSNQSDVFIELFLRNGSISNIEKDYGCCK